MIVVAKAATQNQNLKFIASVLLNMFFLHLIIAPNIQESAPSTAMSSCEKNVVGDGELDLKELLRAKEEELKIVKAKLRKSEATCKRLHLALLDKIGVYTFCTRMRTMKCDSQ